MCPILWNFFIVLLLPRGKKSVYSHLVLNFVVRSVSGRCPARERAAVRGHVGCCCWPFASSRTLSISRSLHPLGKRCVCALPSVCSKMLLIFKLCDRAHDAVGRWLPVRFWTKDAVERFVRRFGRTEKEYMVLAFTRATQIRYSIS